MSTIAMNGAPLARRFRLALLIVVVLTGCDRDSVRQLDAAESQIITELGFDAELLALVKTSGTSFERLEMEDGLGNLVKHAGVVLVMPAGDSAAALSATRTTLAGSAYSAWINDDGFGRSANRIAIMRTHDQFVYLDVARTDGINWDLEHDEVVARYREWAAKYGLELRGAGLDWISARVSKPPADWLVFAREVYAFCPDVVDQGTSTVEALATEMRTRNELFLWWD